MRYDEITQKNAEAVGLSQIPGTWDDEGYCAIHGHHINQVGFQRADLKAGDVLEVVGVTSWERKAFRYYENKVVDLTDVHSKLVRKSDGTEFLIGCSIDGSASESVAYQPVTNDYTKAYLTTLGLRLKQSFREERRLFLPR